MGLDPVDGRLGADADEEEEGEEEGRDTRAKRAKSLIWKPERVTRSEAMRCHMEHMRSLARTYPEANEMMRISLTP